MDDRQIIRLLEKRDNTAVSETEKKYGKLLFSLAMGILGSSEDAKEIVNDTLLVLWNSSASSPPENLKAYLCKITRNQALKRVRRDRAQKRSRDFTLSLEEIGDIFPSDENPEDALCYEETKKAVFGFIYSLDEQSRKIFMRRYWYFDSVKDIAKAFSVSESNVKTNLFRIRKKLKKHLEKEGVEL